ncbi:MAG: UDP-3-O-(3-hydroxymyristoyl)glucosamine N-acyltransferase [Chitinophagaceae bacterium]
MRFEHPVPLASIAQLIGAEIIGNKDGMVTGINEIHKVETGDLVFVDHPKYYDACLQSAATYIIINKATEVPQGKALLLVDEPFEAYLRIVRHYRPFSPSMQMVSETATVGEGTVIMPGSYIGNHVRIGRNCIIHPLVTIGDHCIIGDDVIIQSGTVIGSDAFYYNRKTGREIAYRKMESCGRVVLGNAVEIGANCTIDRGVTHDTVIGTGTKFDNMIHIGHDTVIGKNCLFAANVLVGGCTTIKDNVVIWGGAIINKTITIGENAVLYARTGVSSDLEGNKTYFGAPAQEARTAQKDLVWIKRIPQLWEKVMKG